MQLQKIECYTSWDMNSFNKITFIEKLTFLYQYYLAIQKLIIKIRFHKASIYNLFFFEK